MYQLKRTLVEGESKGKSLWLIDDIPVRGNQQKHQSEVFPLLAEHSPGAHYLIADTSDEWPARY